MKKALSIILVLAMLLSLAACSSSSDPKPSDKPAEASTTAAAGSSSSSGEPYAVQLLLPTMQAIPADEDVQAVEDAINNYMRDTLGITEYKLDLILSSLFDYTTTINMQLAGGQKMDLLYTGPLNTAVSNGYLTDLTPYLDKELAGAVGVLPEGWISCGEVGGTVYAIPCYKGQVLSWKYIYDKSMVDGVYDMSKVKSVDDLDDMLAAVKTAHPEEHMMVFNNQLVNLYGFQDHTSIIGTYFATVGDSTEIVNYFATDAFKKGCEKAYAWSQLGYSDPEGSTNTLSHDAVVMSGASKGVIMGHAYSIDTVEKMFTMNNSFNADFGAVEIATSDMSTNTLVYGIAYTSENPAAAASMMNLIWTDEFIASTLIYGVEGISWEWNADHTSIQYPEGLGLESVPYSALYTCGAFGNQFLLYGFDGNTSEADKTFMKELIDNAWYPPLFGFTPDSSKVSTQVAAISNVYDQYFKVLTYGDVNPDEYLPQFLSALEAAGINDVIAEFQTQADAWLAARK